MTRFFKTLTRQTITSICAPLLLLLVFASNVTAERRPIDWIVAIVDREIVTYTQLIDEMRITASRMGANLESIPDYREKELAENVLENLINESIILQEAKRRGLSASPAEVEEETNTALERVRSQFPNEQAFERALATEFTTPEKLRKQYEEQSEAQILRRKLIEHEIRREIRITEQDVRDAHSGRQEEIHVRHILVRSQETALDIRRRLQDGEDFGSVAGSIDAVEAADLGWVRRGKLVSAFENAAFGLELGEISDVVKTRFGYHVIEVLDRRTTESEALSPQLANEIRNEIYSRAFDERFREYLDRLKEEAYTWVKEDFYEPSPA